MRALALAALAATLASASAQPPEKKADPKKGEPEPKFNMKVKTADIQLGRQLTGAKLSAADLAGKVVVVDFWGVNCAPCLAAMPGTAALNAELADFGLVVIGSHVQPGTPEQIKSVAASRGANFPITEQTRVTGGNDFQGIPHLMVFDHTGACVFRGDPKGAEHAARLAVGEMLVTGADRTKFGPAVGAVAADLKKGRPPAGVLPRVVALANAGGEPTAGDAKALLGALTAGGQKRLDRAKEVFDADPVGAFVLLEKVPAAYKGTPVAKGATELLTKLKRDKAVAAELAARPALEQVKQAAAALGARPGADKAGGAEFQKAHAAALAQLRSKVAAMKKSWPDARATAEAAELAERFAAQ